MWCFIAALSLKSYFLSGGGVWHGCSFWELTSLNKGFIRAICFVGWRCITVNKRDRFQRRLTSRPWKIIRKQLIYIYAGEPMQNHSLRSLSAPIGAQELFTWSIIMRHCFLAVPGALIVKLFRVFQTVVRWMSLDWGYLGAGGYRE